ncbi:MerR family transcriptional regulator [Spirochaetia bacterium]|nr:MerR family transcriptional regulator [Spirochaetia bacterium]GHU31587.1 MerR family transcriptional regulator [Spirochaetia bacterium]
MTIAEVGKKYELSIDTLRYYERIGLLPPVKRGRGGFREYDEEACNWVYFIKCMRNAGITVEALTEYVALFQQGASTIPARKALLVEQRELLAKRSQEIVETLARLDKKIDGYEERLLKYEQDNLV